MFPILGRLITYNFCQGLEIMWTTTSYKNQRRRTFACEAFKKRELKGPPVAKQRSWVQEGLLWKFHSSKCLLWIHLLTNSFLQLRSFLGGAVAICTFSTRHNLHFLEPSFFIGWAVHTIDHLTESFSVHWLAFLSLHTSLLRAVPCLLCSLLMAVRCSAILLLAKFVIPM